MNKFHLEDHGSGPALLLLHGLPSPISAFVPITDPLESTFRLLIPERPGYGRSPSPDGPFSAEGFEEALETRLLAGGVRSVSIVSYSGGALLALSIAARRRLAVDRIVCLAGFAAARPPVAEQLRQIAAGIRAGAIDLESPAFRSAYVASAVAPASRRDALLLDELAGWFAVVRDARTFADELDWCASADVRSLLPRVSASVTVLAGEHDEIAPLAAAIEIAQGCPTARLEVVRGVGHCLIREEPSIGALVRHALTQ